MIRKAIPDDLPALYELRSEAEEWLAASGIDQWVPAWRDRARNLMKQRVEQGKTWIDEDDQGIRWTLSFDDPDLDFWTEDDYLDDALYMYKFIVARRCKGVGSEALKWAIREASKQGKNWLRIDFHRNNDALASYYRNQGFTDVRIVETEGRLSGWLMQISTSS